MSEVPSDRAQPPSLIRQLGPAGPLALIAATMPAILGLTLAGFMGTVGEWVRSFESAGVVLYIAAFAVLSGLALLPTWVQAALGGWAFGMALGYPAALAGFWGGSVIGYAVARWAASGNVEEVIEKHAKWRAVRDALVGSGFWKTLGIVTLVRLPFNSPFAVMNLVMGSTRVNAVAYLIGTLVGMAPRTAVYVFVAAGIEGAFSTETAKAALPAWVWWSGIVSVVAVVFIVAHIANKAIARVTGRASAPEPGEAGLAVDLGAGDSEPGAG